MILEPQDVSYRGVPARMANLDLPGAGRRASIIEWLGDAVGQEVEHPAGTIHVRILTGDGRDGTLVVHAETTVPSWEAAVEWATAQPQPTTYVRRP